ncbi:type II toxin-antitoxin system RelE/ParE family toxin [Aurantimonas sp. VKM B-3413]|uniref:type II toxin-antitoxin system RelE/ParE family toxin n=1 Tax=Aurantimonas sp. VKM B-3413 TaxID=2779401 RepID=UPI00351D65AC
MKRVRVIYHPEALADRQQIYRDVFAASQSLTIARGFVNRITACCQRIGDVPPGGRPRDDLETGFAPCRSRRAP